jgi:hypothetical protein
MEKRLQNRVHEKDALTSGAGNQGWYILIPPLAGGAF